MDLLSVISLHNRLCYLTLKSFNSAGSNVQYLDFPNELDASELSRLPSSKTWEQLLYKYSRLPQRMSSMLRNQLYATSLLFKAFWILLLIILGRMLELLMVIAPIGML